MPLTLGKILLLIFATWHYALRCGFVSDDHAVVEGRKDIIPDTEKNPKKENYWLKVFNDGIVMYYLNRLMFKLGFKSIPFPWHLLSLGLHLLNCWLLYCILLPLLGPEQAVIAISFWAVNPMLNQDVAWISGRCYLIAVTLTFTAMLFWRQPLIVLPLYMAAVITNISITFLPILLKMMYPQAWQPNFYIILMLGAGIPFILWKFKKRFTAALVLDRDNFYFKRRRFNMLARVYAYYIWAFFVPVRMGWYHQAGFRYNPKWERFNIWTLTGYCLVIFFIKQNFWGWWFLLGMLPNMNLFATNSFLQDRYMYFGTIGIAVILTPWLAKWPVAYYCLMTFYITRAYMYSRHLINDEEMYRENWRNHPLSDYAVNNLSFFLINKQRYEEARVVIMRGLEIEKANKMLWYNLGITWAAQGHFQNDEGKFRFLKALDCWKQALQIEPRWSKPAEDMKKLVKLLVDNKVLTPLKEDAIPGMPEMELPV